MKGGEGMDGRNKSENQQQDQGSKGGQANESMDQQDQGQDAFVESSESDSFTEGSGRQSTNG
jgi:hypothetical protein